MKKIAAILRFSASPAATAGLLFILALLIIHGTLYQAVHGIYEAQAHIFDAWIVLLAGVVPFPGVKFILALLAVNLLAAGAARIRPAAANAGFMLAHIGIALLLAGAFGSSIFRTESVLSIGKGESSHAGVSEDGRALPIPIVLTLNDFRISYAPGTDSPRDYESRLHAMGNGIDRDIVISMNRPFRYRDFTFYQTSYSPTENGTITILTAVKDPFRSVPPVTGIIIAIGLALHFVLKARRLQRRSDA